METKPIGLGSMEGVVFKRLSVQPEAVMQSEAVTEGEAFTLRWLIHPLTGRDIVLFLTTVQKSLNETAYEFLSRQDLPKNELAVWRDRTDLIELEVIRMRVGSFELDIRIKWKKDPDSDSLVKKIAKGTITKVAIAWISALVLVGVPQASTVRRPPAPPAVKQSVANMVAALEQNGKRSSLLVSYPEFEEHVFIPIGDKPPGAPAERAV